MSLLFFSCLKIILFPVKYFCGRCIMLERSLGLLGWLLLPASKNVSGMHPSPKLPPEEWATLVVLLSCRLNYTPALNIRFWLSVLDMYVHDWETKKLILWNTGWIVSSLKCSEVNNVRISNSSGSEFTVPGVDYHRAGSLIIMSLSLWFSSFIVPTQGNCS